jgi:hypothetical protein
MGIASFLIAVVVSVVIAALLLPTLAYRGRHGGMGGFLFLFLLVFFGTWALGSWVLPFGPRAWGAPWLLLLLVAVVIGLLIAATAAPYRPRPGPSTAAVGQETRVAEESRAVFGMFFWMLLAVLLISIAAAYTVGPPSY